MERTFESAAAHVGCAASPLASHLGAFVSSLIDQQYAASVVYIKARHALAFDRWLGKCGVVLAGLSDVHIERYQHRAPLGPSPCVRSIVAMLSALSCPHAAPRPRSLPSPISFATGATGAHAVHCWTACPRALSIL